MFKYFLRPLGVLAMLAIVASPALHLDRVAAQGTTTVAIAPGLDPTIGDPTCKACDDFYRFATGNYPQKFPLPADQASWGSFDILHLHNYDVLHDILAAAAQDTSAPAGSNEQKIGTYFRSCMNETQIETDGLHPLQAQLDAIAGIHDVESLVRVAGSLDAINVAAGWTISPQTDRLDSSKTIAAIGTASLGMPDRDYYLVDNERTTPIRQKYLAYVTTILTGTGIAPDVAAADAANILTLETAFARTRPPRAALRDPKLTYHPQTPADLQALAPAINWDAYRQAAGSPAVSTINVTLPDYVKALDAEVTATPLTTWKAYLTFKLINTFAGALPKQFADANFGFYSGTLRGVQAQEPRWRRCVGATDNALGEALGAVYVAKVFPPASKARMVALVNNLQGVLHDDISTLDWMTPQTQRRAQIKLAAYTKKIGYPDRILSYAALPVGDVAYATNAIAAQRFAATRGMNKIGKRTNRLEWGMSAPTVNAYYSPANNEIVFPAGILEPPFFSDATDDAVNYGAIGAVIGHEMTHGFDDQGRQFDENGNLRDWWTADDATNFRARATCIVDQFNGYEVAPGDHENGSLVQGEAIADLGGATIAFKAFERTAEYRAHQTIDGYTPEQRFFLSFAHVWAETAREAYERQNVKVDPHPVGRFRVNGTLSNMPEFRAAFACAAADKMVRPNACKIW